MCLRSAQRTSLSRLSLDSSPLGGGPRWPGEATPVGFEPTRGDPIGLAGRRLGRSAKVSMWRWERESHRAGCKRQRGSACQPKTHEGLSFFWSPQSGSTYEVVGDQQSPVVQELPHQRHLWDSIPRGETPSAQQADALAARPKCPCHKVRAIVLSKRTARLTEPALLGLQHTWRGAALAW